MSVWGLAGRSPASVKRLLVCLWRNKHLSQTMMTAGWPAHGVFPQSDGVIVGFISVTCDVDLKLLQDFDLSEFDRFYRPIKSSVSGVSRQVTPLHPENILFTWKTVTQVSHRLPNRWKHKGPDQDGFQLKKTFSAFSSLLLTRITSWGNISVIELPETVRRWRPTPLCQCYHREKRNMLLSSFRQFSE